MGFTVQIEGELAERIEAQAQQCGESAHVLATRMIREVLDHDDAAAGFVVKPFDTRITSDDWKSWGETKLEDSLQETEQPVAR